MTSITSILVPPTSTALVTLADVKMELDVTGPQDDVFLTNLINRASSVITQYIGRSLGLQTIQQIFRRGYAQHAYNPYPPAYGNHQHTFSVRPLIATYTPVTAITSIVEDGGSPLDPDTDFEVEVDSGLIWRLSGAGRWDWTAGSVKVVYTAGWVLPTSLTQGNLPYAISDVAISLIRLNYFARGNDPAIITVITEGVGRTSYQPKEASNVTLDAGQKSALEGFRQVVR